jgi:hypothetical protein
VAIVINLFKITTIKIYMQCNFPYIKVYLPLIIPSAFFGMYIGFGCYNKIKRNMQMSGAYIYSMMFLMFGLMNMSAIFADCLFPYDWKNKHDNKIIPLIFNLADVSLSSFVNYTFMLAGLVDINILKDHNKYFKFILYGGFLLILFGYFQTILGLWPNGLQILYMYSCIIGMMVFNICAIIRIYQKKIYKTICPLLCANFSGFIGIYLLQKYNWFCSRMPWFNNIVIWFLCSALSMHSLYRYYTKSKNIRYDNMLHDKMNGIL